MIQDLKMVDREKLSSLINTIDTDFDIEEIEDIKANSTKCIVWEEDAILGLAYATVLTNDANEKEAQVSYMLDPNQEVRVLVQHCIMNWRLILLN
ncbi:hypothetical protein [Virgibacillus sp. DJP39]|uniref:hypothetical protein n=1 Tax=Virgibacillus sp. DJP39 TaxID=3409790 RepID=UPI003BB4B0A4